MKVSVVISFKAKILHMNVRSYCLHMNVVYDPLIVKQFLWLLVSTVVADVVLETFGFDEYDFRLRVQLFCKTKYTEVHKLVESNLVAVLVFTAIIAEDLAVDITSSHIRGQI